MAHLKTFLLSLLVGLRQDLFPDATYYIHDRSFHLLLQPFWRPFVAEKAGIFSPLFWRETMSKEKNEKALLLWSTLSNVFLKKSGFPPK